MTPDDVLRYWFGDWNDAEPLAEDDAQLRRWWSHGEELDAEVRGRFGELHARICAGGEPLWLEDCRSLLARVIVLDQFSRVLHRGTGKAFAFDTEARRMTSVALERAWDRDLTLIERAFLYMPMMHAEDRASHRRALMLFTSLAEDAEELGLARSDYYRRIVSSSVRHKEIIDRFGRYPHRNFPMERTSTPEELAFLGDDGNSF